MDRYPTQPSILSEIFPKTVPRQSHPPPERLLSPPSTSFPSGGRRPQSDDPPRAPSRGTSPLAWGVLLPLPAPDSWGATPSKFAPLTSVRGGWRPCHHPPTSIPGRLAPHPQLPAASTLPPSSTPPRRCPRRIVPIDQTLPPVINPTASLPDILLAVRRLRIAPCGQWQQPPPVPQHPRLRQSLVSLPATSALTQHPL